MVTPRPTTRRCRCARRCCRSCGTRCLAARRRVPAGAGALAARVGPCCRCAPSVRCASATASSTRPARAGMRAARTAAPSASWTTRGRPAGPGRSSPPPAPTCASARSAGASRRCGPPGSARPRAAWAPPPRPPARPGRGLAPPAPASWPNTSDHRRGRASARTDCRDGTRLRPPPPLLPQRARDDASILPSVPGEVRGPDRSLPAPPSGLARVCRGFCTPHPLRTRGVQEQRTPGAGGCGAFPGSGKQSAGRTPSWDCSGSPRLDAALPTSGGGEGLWADGCHLAPLYSSLSLLFLGRNLGISMRPPGRGSVGPPSLPLPHPSPRWNKKKTKPPNRGYLGLIFWVCEDIEGLGPPGSLLRITNGMFAPALHSPSLPTASRSAQVPAAHVLP